MYRGLIASVLLVTLMVGTSSAELVGWWKFDESGGGDATDSGSSGTTGTAFGSAVDRVDVDGELFGLGLAVDLAANAEGENYFDLGAADGGLNPSAGPFAIAAWAKVAGAAGGFWGGVNSVFGFGDCCAGGAPGAADRHNFEIGIDDSPARGVFAIDTRGAAGEEAEALPGIGSPIGNWVHVVGVKRADGTASFYINGGNDAAVDFGSGLGTLAPDGISDSGTDAANVQNKIQIGRNPFGHITQGDRAFNGMIGDVQFYHQELSEADALHLFENPGSSLGTVTPTPDAFSWRNDSSGDWNLNANWTPSTSPNANSHSATLGAAITSSRTVFTDTDVTVQSVQFENANSYIIAGGATVTLDGGDGSASVNVLGPSGVHEFQSRVTLASDTDVDIATGTTLEFNNRLTLADNTLTKVGGGTLAINNNLSAGGGMVQQFEGKISGGGTIAGDVNVFAGTIAPGDVAAGGNLAAVPEPAAVALIGMGLVLLVLRWGCDSRILLRSGMTCLLLIGVMAGSSSAELVGWWKLDEASGDAMDSGSSDTTGTAHGITTRVDVSGEVAGLGNAVDLTDGGNANGQNYFDLGAADGALNPGAGPFSIAAWGKLMGEPGGEWGSVASMFGFGDCCGTDAQRSAFELSLDNNPSRAIFAVDTRGDSGKGEGEAIEYFAGVEGNWIHMVGVKRADGTGSLYVDGGNTVAVDFNDDGDFGAFTVGSHPFSANTQNAVQIGRNPFGAIAKGDRSWNGLIGDIQLYHEELSQAQALQLFENPGTSLSSGPVETPDTFSWRKDLSGDWGSGSNWTPFRGPPSTNEHTAVFGDIITAKRTVFTDADVTVKNIQFENANSYVIAGGSTVQLDGGTGTASISVAGSSGTHEFQTRVAMLTDTQLNVATGTTLEFNNRLNLGGNTLTKTGGGDLAINSFLNTGGGVLELSAGGITGEGTIVGDVSLLAGTISPGFGGTVSAVPEPSSLLLTGLSLLLLVVRRVI